MDAGKAVGSADRLDVGEAEAYAAGGSQRCGDLVVDLRCVDTRAYPTAIIAQLNDLHRCATRWRLRSGVSRGQWTLTRQNLAALLPKLAAKIRLAAA